MKKAVSSVLLCFLLLLSSITIGFFRTTVDATGNAVSGISSKIDDILRQEVKKAGATNLQNWLDGSLTQGAGLTSDWFVFAIRQYSSRYSFSNYAKSLKEYVIKNEDVSAVTQQRFALLFIAVGQNSDYVVQTADSTIGEFGIMSWIFGLHLLNNGYTSTKASTSGVVEKLLSMQLSDRGWALSGTVSDVDVTAMAIQALAPHYKSKAKVKTAVDAALTLLSERQMSTGEFQSYGKANSQSTSQVITALSCLGINGITDTRFIKNDNTLLDGLLRYQLPDKSFSHTLGESSSISATAQALGALVSVWRMDNGYGSFYILSQANGHTSQTSPSTTLKTTLSTNPELGSSTQSERISGTSDSAIVYETSDTDIVQENGGRYAATESETQKREESKPANETATDSTIQDSSLGKNAKWLILLIALTVIGSGLVLIATGKITRKRSFALIVVSVTVLFTIIVFASESCAPNISGETTQDLPPQNSASVTLVIQCKDVLSIVEEKRLMSYEKIVPTDGIILSVNQIEIQSETTTVLELLQDVCDENRIPCKIISGYISSINGLTERSKDFGPQSGWVYSVNDVYPSVGSDSYRLKDGDVVELRYVTKMVTIG